MRFLAGAVILGGQLNSSNFIAHFGYSTKKQALKSTESSKRLKVFSFNLEYVSTYKMEA